MKKLINTKRGFTLLELLVVVLIIGILSGIALPKYHKAIDKAEMANVLSNFKDIRHAAYMYYLQHRQWPTNMSDLDVKVNSTKWTYSLGEPLSAQGGLYADGRFDKYETANWPAPIIPRGCATIAAVPADKPSAGALFYDLPERTNQPGATATPGVFCCVYTSEADKYAAGKKFRRLCQSNSISTAVGYAYSLCPEKYSIRAE